MRPVLFNLVTALRIPEAVLIVKVIFSCPKFLYQMQLEGTTCQIQFGNASKSLNFFENLLIQVLGQLLIRVPLVRMRH